MFGTAWLQRKLLFPSHFVTATHQRGHIPQLERWWVEHEQGKSEVWFLPAHGVAPGESRPLVLFAHGNGELIDQWPELLEPYRRLGLHILLPEYRSYGRSAGTPSEQTIVRDFEAALSKACADARVDAERFIFHGRSLGGGVVCALSKRRKPRALVLESTFTSIVDVARGMGFPRFLVHDVFNSIEVVKRFDAPILVLHGRGDTLIPVRHAERLAAANTRAKLVLYDAGHNDLPPEGADYWQQIEELLRTAL